MIAIPKDGTVVLFDSGYLFFYRYHATMKYLKFRHEDPPLDLVQESFIDHLDKQLAKTKKKLKASLIIFCMDVPLKDIWRTKLTNDYKGTREHEIPIMPGLKEKIIETMDRYGIRLTHPNLEADDVAYMCVKNISEKSPETPINIITSDKDFIQLLKYKNVKIFDGGLKEKKGDPYEELMIKVLAGDKSDNIPSLCGKAKAMKLMHNKEELEEFLAKKKLKERFEMNKRLIDMDNIPKEHQNKFSKTYAFKIA